MQETDSGKYSAAASQFIPAIAVTFCGLAWGAFWYPVRLIENAGVGGAWVSLILFAVATLAPLPWLFRRRLWRDNVASIMLTGFLLGTAFALDPPPQKWSDLKYVLWHQGGSEYAKEETHA